MGVGAVSEEGGGLPSPPGKDKGPGWYPVGTDPNDQVHWDGQGWTARRRWKGAGWDEFPLAPSSAVWDPGTVRQSTAATSWLQVRVPRMKRPTSAGAGWSSVLMVSGVGIIVGSVNAWVTLSSRFARVPFSVNLSGTEHGGYGWISLISGIILVVAGLGMLIGSSGLRRLLNPFAAAAAGASLGISIYYMDRIASILGVPGAQVGWGVIVVLLASVVSLVLAIYVSVASSG